MKRPLRTYIVLAVSLSACFVTLAGCSGIVSSKHVTTTSTINNPSPANAYYFLPLVKVRLIAERKSAPTKQKVSREQESKTATGETTEGGKTTTKSTKNTSDSAKVTTAGTITETACTLTLKETLTEPDPRYMFSLSHLSDIFADDQVTITLSANGLLTKVETTSEGKAGQVLVKLAELAKEIMKASAGLPTDVRVLAFGKEPFQYEVILDPTDAKAIETVNADLNKRGCNLLVDVLPPAFPSATEVVQNAIQRPGPTGGKPNLDDPPTAMRTGIFYRPALPYIVSFKTKDESRATESIQTAQTIYLPNIAPILTFDIKRPAFVKFTQTVEFESGMLKSSSVTKPSEAVGFVNIPVELAKSIVAIPSELFKFRIETRQGEAGVLEAQGKLLEVQKQLLEKQEELRTAHEEAKKQQAGQIQP